jgi:hypothetical protein
MEITENFTFLPINIPRFAYHEGSLIGQFLKELLPFLTKNISSKRILDGGNGETIFCVKNNL